jgi:hypothetical protein
MERRNGFRKYERKPLENLVISCSRGGEFEDDCLSECCVEWYRRIDS